MADLTSPRAIYAKGILFVTGGLLASFLLWMERPTWRVALLLAIAIWCFARAYYFAFYVIEHYVDRDYSYAGLWSFVCYQCRRRRKRASEGPSGSDPIAESGSLGPD